MILYSWKKIYEKSNGKVGKILDIIEFITYKQVPRNKYDKNYDLSRVNWSGENFLVHPEKLLENGEGYSKKEMAQYVGLASLRNYAEYKVVGKTTLDLIQSPLSQDTLQRNRLLRIEDDKIFFKWEDTEK